ncbi:class I SAM-dependent methyltransferase [Paenibacillus wynnii]|uniref:class I SAM-dependent methyltransferase n=1 Tax=Paenibacillus wynnii TaxID=268407 RepID=UPI002791521E|nr:methyltransferase domain-containing protein [Paenibacillus wynnii]MDQ0195704.1 trans-aconitate methyltransferase [Paenibacillus wynnii]
MKQRWNSGDYDSDMAFVSQFGESLMDLLNPSPGERIMDWGCGTGDLAAAIAARGTNVTGIDASAEMIHTARSKYPQITFVEADGQSYVSEAPVDAIFSNAALHWLLDKNGTASSISSSLRTNGRFIAEFGGQGNIDSIVNTLPRAFTAAGCLDKLQLPWYFPTIGEYTTLLEKHGLTVQLALCFDRPTPLEAGEQGFARWMNTFANGILSVLTPSEREEVIEYMVKELKPSLYQKERWVMDYRRIRIAAYKR